MGEALAVLDLGEGLPRLREDNMEKAARSYKAVTGVGCDGFHPRSTARDVTRNEKRNGEKLRK